MKPKFINLSDAMNAYRDLVQAQKDLEFYRRFNDEAGIENSQRRKEAADAELQAASTPIVAEIKDAEGRASARTITPSDILGLLTDVEDHLGIPKTHLKGVSVTANPNAQSFPAAYKYTPEATYFRATHTGKNWRLERVWRDTCRTCRAAINLTDDARAAILCRAETL